MLGQGHLASLEADSDTGRCYLLVGSHRAAEIFVDYLALEGEVTGLEWLTPHGWLGEDLALETAETLLDSPPGATVEICEPGPTRSQIKRSVGLLCERPGVAL